MFQFAPVSVKIHGDSRVEMLVFDVVVVGNATNPAGGICTDQVVAAPLKQILAVGSSVPADQSHTDVSCISL
jgi:hypothetical protein